MRGSVAAERGCGGREGAFVCRLGQGVAGECVRVCGGRMWGCGGTAGQGVCVDGCVGVVG